MRVQKGTTRGQITLFGAFAFLSAIGIFSILFVYIFSSAERTERQLGRRDDVNETIIANSTCDPDFGECGEDEFRGVCWFGKCVCAAGWHGPECEIENVETSVQRCTAEDECSLHGECFFGKCICNQGFTGTQCELKLYRDRYCSMSENNCGQSGQCVLSEMDIAECYCPINGQDSECMLI